MSDANSSMAYEFYEEQVNNFPNMSSDDNIAWAQKYLSITMAIKEAIVKRKQDVIEQLLIDRDMMLDELVPVVESMKQCNDKEKRSIFMKIIDTVFFIESSSCEMIVNQMDELLLQMSRAKDYKRTFAVNLEKLTISRFIDTKM